MIFTILSVIGWYLILRIYLYHDKQLWIALGGLVLMFIMSGLFAKHKTYKGSYNPFDEHPTYTKSI